MFLVELPPIQFPWLELIAAIGIVTFSALRFGVRVERSLSEFLMARIPTGAMVGLFVLAVIFASVALSSASELVRSSIYSHQVREFSPYFQKYFEMRSKAQGVPSVGDYSTPTKDGLLILWTPGFVPTESNPGTLNPSATASPLVLAKVSKVHWTFFLLSEAHRAMKPDDVKVVVFLKCGIETYDTGYERVYQRTGKRERISGVSRFCIGDVLDIVQDRIWANKLRLNADDPEPELKVLVGNGLRD